MAQGQADFNTSFLDLLLSALGGVALLMVLFAAIQSSNVKANSIRPKGILVFELKSDTPEAIWMNREVGIGIEDEDGNAVATFSNASPSPEMKVSWPIAPQRTLNVLVESDPDSDMEVALWLRTLHPASDPNDAAYVLQIRELLSQPVTISVYWLDNPSEVTKFELEYDNGFFDQQKIGSR